MGFHHQGNHRNHRQGNQMTRKHLEEDRLLPP